MKEVNLYSDGACSGNPGAGGWGAVLKYKGHRRELSGGEAETTNNRMELTAVIEGLRALKEPCRVTVTTDSQYVANGINLGWAESWKQNGWRKKDKKPALNPELWDTLLTEIARHEVTIVWIKGHAGHPENERCDALAVAEWKKIKEQQSID
ncbi:MAG: ribonuclease HI [Clostridia bacterium]|nr:ribonuclease HI [Clostridia bacterium]